MDQNPLNAQRSALLSDRRHADDDAASNALMLMDQGKEILRQVAMDHTLDQRQFRAQSRDAMNPTAIDRPRFEKGRPAKFAISKLSRGLPIEAVQEYEPQLHQRDVRLVRAISRRDDRAWYGSAVTAALINLTDMHMSPTAELYLMQRQLLGASNISRERVLAERMTTHRDLIA